MNKILLLLAFLAVHCAEFDYQNPLDEQSSNYNSELLEDDDNDGSLNYEDDDDKDGVKNYRDTDSKYFSDYFGEQEEDLIAATENTTASNDGYLFVNIRWGGYNKTYCEIQKQLTYYIDYESNGDIISVEFDFDGDGSFEESFQSKMETRSHTFTKKGLMTSKVRVTDEYGNKESATLSALIYDFESDVDSDPPVIVLEGDEDILLSKEDTYEEDGFSVTDDVYDNNELAEFVYVDVPDGITWKEVGEYTITYTVYDTEGNKAIAERSVIIND